MKTDAVSEISTQTSTPYPLDNKEKVNYGHLDVLLYWHCNNTKWVEIYKQ